MTISYNKTSIGTVKYNNTTLDKVVYNGTTVFEALVSGYSSENTYVNTGVGNGGDRTYSWTRNIGTEVKPMSSSFTSVNNSGNTCYWTFYGSTDNSNWTKLGTTSGKGGTTTLTVLTDNFYQYYKVDQYKSNWRRDDGNDVFSIEPWRIDYLKRK